MRKHNILFSLFSAVIIGGFLYGIIYLLHLRYNTGDVYPPYSSFRADPLGTKALYEGIQDVPQLKAVRHYQSVAKLRDQADLTLLYLGVHPGQFFWVEKVIVSALEGLLLNGNRVILTFTPVYKKVSSQDFWEQEDEEEQAEDESTEEDESTDEGRAPDSEESSHEEDEEIEIDVSDYAVDLPEKWGVDFGYTTLKVQEDDVYESIQAIRQADEALPEEFSWHTALYFEPDAEKNWNTVYEANGHPVIIERTFGKGTLVLCADSYFVSNEALQVERHSELLAWLIGPHTTVVFDETHLGVMESPGIATLIRKYRLMWFVGSLIVLAGLFVWKNIVSFVPPADALSLTNAVSLTEERAGKDSIGGLINLLRQNIPPQNILAACVAEWEKSVSHRRKELGSTIDEVRDVAAANAAQPARKHIPVESYRKICQILEKQ
jgi:hypothetical protein